MTFINFINVIFLLFGSWDHIMPLSMLFAHSETSEFHIRPCPKLLDMSTDSNGEREEQSTALIQCRISTWTFLMNHVSSVYCLVSMPSTISVFLRIFLWCFHNSWVLLPGKSGFMGLLCHTWYMQSFIMAMMIPERGRWGTLVLCMAYVAVIIINLGSDVNCRRWDLFKLPTPMMMTSDYRWTLSQKGEGDAMLFSRLRDTDTGSIYDCQGNQHGTLRIKFASEAGAALQGNNAAISCLTHLDAKLTPLSLFSQSTILAMVCMRNSGHPGILEG